MKNPKTLIVGLLCAALAVWVIFVLKDRVEDESANNAVEICLDFDETNDLCIRNGYSFSDFIERAKAIGITSLAIGEENLQSLAQSGRVISFSSQDYLRFKILDLVAPGGVLSQGSIVVHDQKLAARVFKHVKARYNARIALVQAGKFNVITSSPSGQFASELFASNPFLGFSEEKESFAAAHGLKVALRPQNSGNPLWIFDETPQNFSCLLFDQRDIPGFPWFDGQFSKEMALRGVKFVALEFAQISGQDSAALVSENSLIRGHTIPVLEMTKNADFTSFYSRWERAVAERSIRFMFFHFYQNKSIEDNLSYLRGTARLIKGRGFDLQETALPSYPSRGMHRIWLLFTFIIGLSAPVVAIYAAKNSSGPIKGFLVANLITLLGGALISSFLSDVYFMQKVSDMPGVKPLMFLPVLISVFFVLKPDELRKLWTTSVKTRHLLLVTAVLVAAFIIASRSGNSAAGWMRPEQGMRDFLESLLIVRPRTKEFLFGQPLLLLGLYSKNPYLMLCGVVGQVSIVNTFLHAHIPFFVSVIRTFHGIWIGLLLGLGVERVVKMMKGNK
jgi:hypothetical protein